MVSVKARRSAIAGVLWLIAIASPCAARSQPSLERLANDERRIVEEIREEQARNGAYSPN